MRENKVGFGATQRPYDSELPGWQVNPVQTYMQGQNSAGISMAKDRHISREEILIHDLQGWSKLKSLQQNDTTDASQNDNDSEQNNA